MNKESFRILKEINSLNQKIQSESKLIQAELGRIEKIEKMREQRKIEQDKYKSEHQECFSEMTRIENESERVSQLLDKNRSQLNQVFSENEIKTLQTQIEFNETGLDKLQTEGIQKLEELESLETMIKEADQFLNGSTETILEIESEIKQTNAEAFNIIRTSEERLKLLFEQLPEIVVKKINSLLDKGPHFNPISEITEKNDCYICHFALHKSLVDAVERQFKFHTCTSCGRILIPQSSKYL